MKTELRISVLVSLVACALWGGPFGTTALSTLLNRANAVVVATVDRSSVTGNDLVVDLGVLRTIKGAEQAGRSVHLTWPLTSPRLSRQHADLSGTTGIWFLQQIGSSWTVLPLGSGDVQIRDLYIRVPVTTSGNAAFAIEASESNKLIQELKIAAADPATVSSISQSLQVMDKGLGSEAIMAAFSDLSLSENIPTKVAGVSGLLRTSAPGAVSALLTLPFKGLSGNAQDELAHSLCWYRDSDSTQLTLVQSLLDPSCPLKLRRCAAHALREIHTAQTLPTLEKLLEDGDSKIRYDAVVGLAQFGIGLPIAETQEKPTLLSSFKPDSQVTQEMRLHYPSESVFAANEQEYISFWKVWLLKRGIQ